VRPCRKRKANQQQTNKLVLAYQVPGPEFKSHIAKNKTKQNKTEKATNQTKAPNGY
jgi:hypothetical protein